MFRKEFKIKTNVLTKNSERKQILESVSKFYRIDLSILTNQFGKTKLNKIKIECHNGDYSTVYQCDNKPIFFEVNRILVPTIYCLWLIPDFLVLFFTIHEETVRYLINGSDLMIPGIIVNKPINETSYGSFTKNELASINTDKNRSSIAIGMTNYDNYDMFMAGGKGKAVNILHVHGDYLWSSGDRSLPPQIDWNNSIDNNENIIDLEDTIAELSIADNDNEKELIDFDRLLHDCFLHALKCSLTNKDLPIIFNVFYANHVLRFCPANVVLDIKKTSYKKLSVFLQSMEKEGLITLVNNGPGIQAIKSIDKSHEKLKFEPKFEFREIVKIESDSNVELNYSFPKIEEIYFVTEKSCNLLKFEGLKKTDVIKPTELREIITKYVKINELQSADGNLVQLDGVLKSSCLNPNENLCQLSWKTLFDRFHKNLTPGIRMDWNNKTEPVCYRNMKTPKIKIESTNKNNKTVTRIEGVEIFRIDVKQLCSKIQQTIGCSCGTVADKSGVVAIQAQGDQRKRISSILFDSYKVPKQFVEGWEKSK